MNRITLYCGALLAIGFLFFPSNSCDIKLSCDNVSHIIVYKYYAFSDDEGSRITLYTINVYLQHNEINLRKDISQCSDEYATLWAGDTVLHRHNVRQPPIKADHLTPDSFSYGWDSLQLVRATEDEAFALARAICAEKTDPELRP